MILLLIFFEFCCAEISLKNEVNVSVVVPIFNAQFSIADCLNSVLNQTLKSLEVICVDDGSQDNTSQVLNSFSGKDDRIFVIHQKNCGVSCACNAGLSAAKGDYVTFVHADDFLVDVRAYEIAYQKAKDGDFDMVQWGFLWGSRNNKTRLACREEKVLRGQNAAESLMPNKKPLWTVWSRIYKGSMLRNSGVIFDTRTRNAEDIIFIIDLIPFVDSILCLNKIFYCYGHMTGSLGHKRNDTDRYVEFFLVTERLNKMKNNTSCQNCITEKDIKENEQFILQKNERIIKIKKEKIKKKNEKEKRRLTKPGSEIAPDVAEFITEVGVSHPSFTAVDFRREFENVMGVAPNVAECLLFREVKDDL